MGVVTPLFPPALIGAIIFGHVARREIKDNPSTLKGAGLSLVGLILGYLYLAIIVVGLATLPGLLHTMRQLDEQEEQKVVPCLRELHDAAGSYYANHKSGFPATLAALNPIAEDKTLDADFKNELIRLSWYTSGMNFGYMFKYVPISTKRDGFCDAYAIHADPVRGDLSRRPHFYIDQTGILRSEAGNEANEKSPPVGN
jgi:hypothetical protein